MRLTIVGCAGSFPGKDSAASCYLLEAEGFRLVIDLGNGALGPLQRHVGIADVDAVCVSHLHSDHCVDVHSYGVAREIGPDGPLPPLPVYGPIGTAQRIGLLHGVDGDRRLADRFTFETLVPGTREIGPFRITVARMNHPVETFGFRVSHGGWTVAYSADTGESSALIALAKDADLLLCEAAYLDAPGYEPGVHLSGRQAGEHAAKAGAGELVLTHLVAWNDPARSLDEAAAVFPGQLSLAQAHCAFGPDARLLLPAT